MMIKLKCPKCGAGIKHWSYLEDAATSRNILGREGNTLHIAADYEVEPLLKPPTKIPASYAWAPRR